MDERELEIRRRHRRKQMIMKRRRRRRRILLISMFVILLVFIAGLSACFKMCGSDKKDGKQDEISREYGENSEKGSEGGNADQKGSENGNSGFDQSMENETKTISLSASDIYKGDLILVNNLYEYRFEQNASEIQLISLDEYKDGAIKTGKEDLKLAQRILDSLYAMISDCNTSLGVDNTGVTSAYRTREYQESVYNQYVEVGGVEYAEAYVADPGYSEHHTGLSLDLGIYYYDGSEGRFSGSPNADWMDAHCQEYGFIRRYKDDKKEITGISNESWHFRYVGVPHASYMNENNLCMEEYIEYLRAHTSAEAPLEVTCSTGTYSIYATREKNMVEPSGEYTISGDNIDGFILTIKQDL